MPYPSYKDNFHEVRQMVEAWNENMMEVFVAGWVSCLDESMSIWTSRWICPGFMFVPWNLHTMGNEYHSICCGICEIMFAIEMVEGKDAPPERGRPEYHENGKTGGLLLRLCGSIFHTGKVVIMESWFCVLLGIITLKKIGVYALALIKKQRYWPNCITGSKITDHFGGEELGTTTRNPGMIDGVKCDIFATKGPDYVMMLMSTY